MIDHATSSSLTKSGWLQIIFNRQITPPGGVNRPCSQSRKVATGVLMRSENACCDKPVLSLADLTKICSGVVIRPKPACISASPCLRSSNAMPASASIACAIFSMSTLHRLLNVTGLDIILDRFFIKRNQDNSALLSQIKINNANTAAFTFSCYRPSDFTRTVCAWYHIARQWVIRNPSNKCHALVFRPDFIGLIFKSRCFDNGSHGLYCTEYPYTVNQFTAS